MKTNSASARAVLPGRTNTGLDPYTGPWGETQVIHLLKRVMFGAKRADIAHFTGMTMDDAIAELLVPTPPPAPPVNNYAINGVTDANVALGETWVNAPYDVLLNGLRGISFKNWWISNQLNQERSIHEKMTLFWHNHFSTEMSVYIAAHLGYRHYIMLRENALGNFKDLTRAVTVDSAMLRYLNGNLNSKQAPDENYARELQELFTIGKSPASQYTEDDVKEAAKVLTGYQINVNTGYYLFNPNRHDTTDKQFSAFYNNTTITGQSGAAGENELDDLLDMIFANNEVALFLCRKLYRFFVYYEIDDATEINIIEPMAQIFRDNNYQLAPVLQALFTSEHFFDPLNMGCLIKSPVDQIVGLCREFDVVFPDAAQFVTQYKHWSILRTNAKNATQELADPPNVAGWAAYYQAPAFHELWINTDTLPKRVAFSDIMMTSGFTRDGIKIVINPVQYTEGLAMPELPDQLIDQALRLHYRIDVSSEFRDFLMSILLSGQADPVYWTQAWLAYADDPTNITNYNAVFTRLQSFYKYLLDQPEHQLS